MSSIVLDLQQELISANCDIIAALRKAHLIASKLQLSEFDAWVQSELNGYACDQDEIPDYRQVSGSIKAWNPYHGWVPVIMDNGETEKFLCCRKMEDSISDLLALAKDSKGYFVMTYSADIESFLDRGSTAPFRTKYSLHVSKHYLRAIKDKVINALIEWTIKLEAEGIVGENMVFSDSEKKAAQGIQQVVNYNYYGNTNVLNAPIERSAIVAGDNAAVSFTYEAAQTAANEITESLYKDSISSDDRETALEMLSDIQEKISQKKKPSIIKSALIGLKDFLFEVGARVTVNLIQAKLQGLF